MYVRVQRIGCEQLLPQPRGEFGRAFGRMLTDALQHIYQIRVGIDAVQLAGADQALDDADVLGAQFGPAKEPILPSSDDLMRPGPR